MCTKAAEMYGSAILNRRGSVDYRAFRARVVRADRAVLSETGQWPPAGRGRADAAHLSPAALVQSVGPGSRRGALRFAGDGVSRTH